jgi:hypothetical protein
MREGWQAERLPYKVFHAQYESGGALPDELCRASASLVV